MITLHKGALGGTRKVVARVMPPILLASAILGIWQLNSAIDSETGTPSSVLRSAIDMTSNGTLIPALAISWLTVLKGFAVAAALGVLLGVSMGYWQKARSWIEPIIDVLRPIAPFAWIPMALLWFGTGGNAGVMITAYAAFFPIVTNVMAGVMRVQGRLVDAAKTLGATQTRTFTHVVFPGALPLTLVGLRLGIGLAWAAVIAAELATGRSTNAAPGIGYLMYLNFATTADLDAIITMMAAIGVSALIADWIMLGMQRFVVWPEEN